jgi:hypothetical protein
VSDSAERRARRKLLAEAYNHLPSREVLQAAADLERAKAQRAHQEEQMALQKGSLAVAVLSQIPRDDELNKPVLADARALLHEILARGIAKLQAPDEDAEEEDFGIPEFAGDVAPAR